MPAGDKTGPEGKGPRTGRSMGYCSGYNSPGFTKGAPRRGRGRRFYKRRGPGFGRGNRNFYYPREHPISNDKYPQNQNNETKTSREEEINSLDEEKSIENEIKAMKDGLDNLREKIKELENKIEQ